MARLFGLSLFVFVATIAALWVLYVRAPGPDVVCEHINAVSLRETAAAGVDAGAQEAVLAAVRDQCIRHKHDKLRLRGRIEWARHAKCVLAANDLATLERC